MAAGPCRNGNQAIRALLYRLAREGIDDIMQDDSAPARIWKPGEDYKDDSVHVVLK